MIIIGGYQMRFFPLLKLNKTRLERYLGPFHMGAYCTLMILVYVG